MKIYRSLDLFSGVGGFSLGLSLATNTLRDRIETICAIDSWETACKTFEQNLGLKPICRPIDNKVIKEINKSLGPFDIVVGGPPCQGFSTAGKRALDDSRNSLVLAFLNAIEITNPKIFVMENVAGFKSFQQGKIYEEVVQYAKKLGYRVRSAVVLASLSGVPQRRKRFLLVGSKSGIFRFPGENCEEKDPSLFGFNEDINLERFFIQKPEDGREQWTFHDATSDLPPLQAGEKKEQYISPPKNSLQDFFRHDSQIPIDHYAGSHKEYFLKLLSYIPQGKSALDPEVQETMPKNLRPKTGFKNSYQRLVLNEPSPTITRNFTTPSSANCIHPLQDRALSIREGARCQSFPDWFTFIGSNDDKRLQIGNAVPPLLAKAIGESILFALANN